MLSSGKTYKVKKEELIGHISKNREKHISEFNIAIGKYRETAITRLKKELNAAENGLKFSLNFIHVIKPQSHEKDYDKVIGLLEMCVDDFMEITAQDYSQYVLDQWDWTHEFSTSNSFYGVGSAQDIDQNEDQ